MLFCESLRHDVNLIKSNYFLDNNLAICIIKDNYVILENYLLIFSLQHHNEYFLYSTNYCIKWGHCHLKL